MGHGMEGVKYLYLPLFPFPSMPRSPRSPILGIPVQMLGLPGLMVAKIRIMKQMPPTPSSVPHDITQRHLMNPLEHSGLSFIYNSDGNDD